jgi:hypothetical protein
MGKRSNILHQQMRGTAKLQQNDGQADGFPGGGTASKRGSTCGRNSAIIHNSARQPQQIDEGNERGAGDDEEQNRLVSQVANRE